MSKSSNARPLPTVNPQGTDDEMLYILQRETFEYFIAEVHPKTGLVADKTEPGSPSSIAAVGMALSSYVTGVERGYMSRGHAVDRVHQVLKFFHYSPQGPEPDATGYKGFYYHFLDMDTGRRAPDSELSTIDTAILMAGVLCARYYFTGGDKKERELRELADTLYARVDWQWALNGGDTPTHGWRPESGFLPYRWDRGYSEAHILYLLALGSPTFPVDPAGYRRWTDTFEWKQLYGQACIYAGPLFIHQMSHIWIDFRGIRDDRNRQLDIDYFENSTRATRIQQQYAIENPLGYAHYGENAWGFTASDGPGPCTLVVDGVAREFFDYTARGVPFGPDDGTISPWAAVASLPFAANLVLPTIRHAIEKLNLKKYTDYGFDASFNPTFPGKEAPVNGWISPWQFGLNQGPIVLMIENYGTGLIWETMKQCPHLVRGLRRAGFAGGWLNDTNEQQ